MTIEKIRQDKKQLEDSIKCLLNEFEKTYGQNTIKSIGITRWNGSNTAFGTISEVCSSIDIFARQ